MVPKYSTSLLTLHIGLLSFVVILLISPVTEAWGNQDDAHGKPTTANLSEIVLGRCNEHIQCLEKDQCPNPGNISCRAVWDEFLAVFQYKKPCNTSEHAYDKFLTMAKPLTLHDQALFWSGVQDAALNVARVSLHYRVLEESLPGYMANNLSWCGDPNSEDGLNYQACPAWNSCNDTLARYWKAASREFSRQTQGKVSVALNSHRDGGAFKNDSVFATIELPNLNPKQVTLVEILLVPNITKQEEGEKCGEGSIKELQRRLDKAGLNWICTYDPLEFRFIQCTTLSNPLDYAACRGEGLLTDEEIIIIGSVLGGIILILMIIVAVVIVQSCRKKYSRF